MGLQGKRQRVGSGAGGDHIVHHDDHAALDGVGTHNLEGVVEVVGALLPRQANLVARGYNALDGEPIRMIREHLDDFGGNGLCTLIGGGKTAPDRAAFYNGALSRYLDFMDSYLAKGETCHQSDNFGDVLAAAEYADAGGGDFLSAMAAA